MNELQKKKKLLRKYFRMNRWKEKEHRKKEKKKRRAIVNIKSHFSFRLGFVVTKSVMTRRLWKKSRKWNIDKHTNKEKNEHCTLYINCNGCWMVIIFRWIHCVRVHNIDSWKLKRRQRQWRQQTISNICEFPADSFITVHLFDFVNNFGFVYKYIFYSILFYISLIALPLALSLSLSLLLLFCRLQNRKISNW